MSMCANCRAVCAPTHSILFGMQGWFVHTIVARRAALDAGVDPSSPDGAAPSPYVTEIMMAAVLSGAAISVLVAPMEGVKARLQVQYAAKGQAATYAGPIDCVRKLVRDPNLGVTRGLYRGWVPTALCRMSNWSYFGACVGRGAGLCGHWLACWACV